MQSGDERSASRVAGFEGFFDEVFPRAFRLAFRMLGERAAAEDAASEAMARAYARWSTVGGLGHRDAWVLRATANVVIDLSRRRRPRPEPPGLDSFEDDLALRLALVAALRALPRRQRDVIVLRYLSGLSEQAVSQALGIAQGTVKIHTHRGLASLRLRLGEGFKEDTLDL